VLFVGTAIGKISVGDVLRTIWPLYLAVLAVRLVVAFVPTLSLWLPSLLRAAPWRPTGQPCRSFRQPKICFTRRRQHRINLGRLEIRAVLQTRRVARFPVDLCTHAPLTVRYSPGLLLRSV
jgi:hypothetical protein